jgi:hydroxymethylbilane synthase
LRTIRLATRKSPLALWQANDVADQIRASFPEIQVEIVGLSTEGDRNRIAALSEIGGKGVFVKELEIALQTGDADFAVHSTKDVPAELPDGLALVALCKRADPRDAFVANVYSGLAELPSGARIGSSSLRRCLQLAKVYPQLVFENLRGNVETRLKRLDDGHFQGIILASAGLARLGLGHRITENIPTDICLPSAGQGAVGLEARADRDDLVDIIRALNHEPTFVTVNCERQISRRLGATCNLPVAAFAQLSGDNSEAMVQLDTFVSDLRGEQVLTICGHDLVQNAGAMADRVADELIDRGALALVSEAP